MSQGLERVREAAKQRKKERFTALLHHVTIDLLKDAYQLAATEEDGTVEENAKIIARIVRAESRSHTKLILVSTSKGGPETALALGKILEPCETTSVKAWLSVGGLIRGTLLADRIMTWPKSAINAQPLEKVKLTAV